MATLKCGHSGKVVNYASCPVQHKGIHYSHIIGLLLWSPWSPGNRLNHLASTVSVCMICFPCLSVHGAASVTVDHDLFHVPDTQRGVCALRVLQFRVSFDGRSDLEQYLLACCAWS